MNRPEYLIVHTAAWPGDPSAAEIDRAHRARGWRGIGYHYVIRKDGTVEAGRPEAVVGAHCRASSMNRRSLGICFSGHHDEEAWTAAQQQAWERLALALMRRYGIGVSSVLGHREVAGAATACPGARVDMRAVRRRLVEAATGIEVMAPVVPRRPAEVPSHVSVPAPREVAVPALMPSGKPKRESLTIRGAGLSAAAVVGALGLRVGFDLEVSEQEVADVVAGVVALLGSVVAILGRVRATERVRR